MLSAEEIKNFEMDPLVRFCYDYVVPISEDRVLATHGGEISLITKSGDLICTYDSIEIPSYDSDEYVYSEKENCYISTKKYINDILLYLDGYLWGLIDYNGNILLEANYLEIIFNGEDNISLINK